MNVSGDNPWKVIDDLKWFAQTDFLADAIVVFEKHRDEQILDEWLKTHDGEDFCKYCPENAECPHGMACYGGEPIEPPCYGADMKEFLYTDSIIEDALRKDMAKNNKLINSLNEIARRNRSQNVATAADQMVPQIYAAIAIALHRTHGFGYKRINDIFVESQHIWEDYAGDGAGMVKKCEEETGVTVCSPEEAQRLMEMQNGM